MQKPWEKEVRLFRKKYNFALFLRYFSQSLAASLALLGGVLLIYKLFFPETTSLLYSGVALAGVVTLVGSLQCRSHFISTSEAVDFVDYYSGAEGALASSWKGPNNWHIGDWIARLSDKKFKSPRWNTAPFLQRVIPFLIFFLAVLALPARSVPPPPVDHGAEQRAREIKARLEKMLQEKQITEKVAEKIRKDIQSFQEKKGQFSQSDWEALDELQKKIDRALAEREKGLNDLARKEEALDRALKEGNLKKIKKARRDLEKAIERLKKKGVLDKKLLSKKNSLNEKELEKELKKLMGPNTSQAEKKRLLDSLSKKINQRDLDKLKKLARQMKKRQLTEKEQRFLEKLARKLSKKDLKRLKRNLDKLRKKTAQLRKKVKKKPCADCRQKGVP